ncbi:hypothetical protein E1B28_000124 [Marasmius oreades]|uniref:Uncharacterized protein n=1 Tax=Marasmius oreades TaxID=181124 RepID=A0A9P7V0N5_9AGAR|nr:uncharacterized protein E1B28_000124 [Marasmius oreades]KAG7098154.1 hypothetical protein E1B28_000124 [Marasmius oreades]
MDGPCVNSRVFHSKLSLTSPNKASPSFFLSFLLNLSAFRPDLATSARNCVHLDMGDLADAYTALTPYSTRTEVAKVLQSIILGAPGFAISESTRTKLLKLLLDDIKIRGSDSRISDEDASQAILAVKILGRNPQGSDYLATESGLSDLLHIASSLKEKDHLDAACDALRCIANAMLLFEDSRSTFISEEVKGGEVCVKMLNEATTCDEIFILSRILFFATVSRSPFVIWLVEESHDGRTISNIVEDKLDLALSRYLKNDKANLAREAIADLLKFTFNLLLYYPKMVDCVPQSSSLPSLSGNEARIMGDFWSPKLDGFLPPILELYLSLPAPNTEPTPLHPPLTNAIHSLITIPVNNALRSKWFHTSAEQPDVVQHTQDLLDKSLAFYLPKSESPDSESIRDFAKSKHPSDDLDDILSPLVILATRLCIGDVSARNRICNWIVPEDMDRDPEQPLDERPNILGRCIRLMGSVYHKRLNESAGELLYAMCGQDAGVLCSKVGYGHVAGFLFEKGVMSAPVTAESPGGGEASSSTTSTAPSATSTSANGEKEGGGTGEGANAKAALESEMTFAGPSDTRQINPITGTYVPEKTSNPMDDMSEEEKEREMDKLFVLFDRMEKTGALSPEQNPVRKAIQKSMQQ